MARKRGRYTNMRLTPSDDVLERLSEQMTRTPGLMRTALKRQITRSKRRLMGKLKKQPGAVASPFVFKSEKQRKWAFATEFGGRGFGAPRTGALVNGWRAVSKLNQGVLLDVYNTQPYAPFVMGAAQQPFHKNTGWARADVIQAEEVPVFTRALSETIHTVGDPTRGI